MDNNNKLVIVLPVVIIMLSVLCILFATGTVSFNVKNSDNAVNQNIPGNNDNKNQFDVNDFIRQTRVTLIEEPNCTGNSDSLIAEIDSNGNIVLDQNMGSIGFKIGNAKYLYNVGILSCDNWKLYYITEDKELYVIDRSNYNSLESKPTSVTEKNVIEFLGVESRNDGSYLKVLLENNNVEYIKYFSTPD